MLTTLLKTPSQKRFIKCIATLLLLLHPVLAIAQSEQMAHNSAINERVHAFWIAQSEALQWVIGISSFALAVWGIGGCIMGYLIFSMTKRDALLAVRQGYGFGAFFWTLTALIFMWIIVGIRNPLWYFLIVLSVVALFVLLFGFLFRTQKTAR